MKSFITLFIISLLLMGCTKENPKPQPLAEEKTSAVQKDVPVFDGKRAFEYLTAQTDFGPRNPGSAGHRNCLTYLELEMQKYADAVNLQEFRHRGYDGKILEMANVVSSFNAQATTRILLLAHWDSRPRADQDNDTSKHNLPILGANDGASGVAILLEIARHLKSKPPTVGVDILFTDGEDYGAEQDLSRYLLGAKYFASKRPAGFSPVFGMLLDMVGDKQLKLRKEQFSMKYAPSIVDLVWSTAEALNVSQFSSEVQGAVIDDHLPFNEIGIKTIDLIDFQYPDESNRYWHTTEDTPDKCSSESLEAVGKVLLHVIYRYTL